MAEVDPALAAVIGRVPVWHPPTEGVAALCIGADAPRFIELRRGSAPKVLPEAAAPQCTLRMSLEVWQALVSGKLSANAALLQQKLKVEGDLALAQSFARAALEVIE